MMSCIRRQSAKSALFKRIHATRGVWMRIPVTSINRECFAQVTWVDEMRRLIGAKPVPEKMTLSIETSLLEIWMKNRKLSFEKIKFENAIWKISAFLFRHQFRNSYSNRVVKSRPKCLCCSTPQYITVVHGPLTRYVKLRVSHAPGMSGTFSPPPTSKETVS